MRRQELNESAEEYALEELKKAVSEKLKCFECNGDLRLINDTLVCKKCSKEYDLTKNLIDFKQDMFQSQYGAQFSEGAKDYEQYYSLNIDFSRALGLTIKIALEKTITLPVHSALEIGCGTGVFTRGCNYYRIAEYILATDISKEMLGEAANKDPSDNVLYLVQDAYNLNIKDNSFNIVMGCAILHHLAYLKKTLSETFRVLTNDGVAVFYEPFFYGNRFIVFLMNIVIEYLKSQRKYSRKSIKILER